MARCERPGRRKDAVVRYFYTSLDRWHAIAEGDELSPDDDLVDDDQVPLRDGTRVRIAVRTRRDARRRVRVPSARWHEVVDRQAGQVLWLPQLRVCSVPRHWVIGAASGA